MSERICLPARCAVALVLSVFAIDASAAGLKAFEEMELNRRLWMAAIGGFSLAVAFAMLVFELRSRRIAVALRRLTELAASVDGRLPEETKRQRVSTEMTRLSDEVLFVSQRMGRERREMAAKLSSWEGMFAASLEASIAIDRTGVIKQLNPAAERLLRVTAADVLGKSLIDVMLPPIHRSTDNAAFASDLLGGRLQGRRQELVAQRRDGRQFPLEVAVAEFRNGDQLGYIVNARDISAHRRLRSELARAREIATDASAKSAPRESYTLEEICGEPIRRLAARAARKGLRFRYEDLELQGVALIGNAARLRRVLANLIDGALHVCEAGELIVHVALIPLDERELRVSASLTATGMTDEQLALMLEPYVAQPFMIGPKSVLADRRIEFFGARLMIARAAGGGLTLQFNQRFEADLSRVTIDLSAAAKAETAAVSVPEAAPNAGAAAATVDPADFSSAAVRLRKNARKRNLGALWAEAHRLTDSWQRYTQAAGDTASSGLVSALSHAARGGDTVNATLLARRFADALEAAATR